MESQQVLQEATQRISVYKLYGVLNLSVSTFAISAIATFVIIWLVICIYYRPTQWGSSSWRTARRKSFSWSVLVPRWFIQSFQALRFLWNAPEIIEVAYAKVYPSHQIKAILILGVSGKWTPFRDTNSNK